MVLLLEYNIFVLFPPLIGAYIFLLFLIGHSLSVIRDALVIPSISFISFGGLFVCRNGRVSVYVAFGTPLHNQLTLHYYRKRQFDSGDS